MPPVVQIQFPQFQVDGGMHPAMTLNAMTTVSRGSSIAVELTTANLEFVHAAAHSKDLQVQKRKRKREARDLPELTAPCVYWRRRGARQPTIMCSYRSEDGVWRTHNQEPAHIDDHDAYAQAVRETECAVQRFYDDKHHEPPSEGEHVE